MKSLELIKWKGRSGCEHKFHLINLVSSEWKTFGILLEISADRLEAWEKEYRGVTAECWRRVMGHWLDVGGTRDYTQSLGRGCMSCWKMWTSLEWQKNSDKLVHAFDKSYDSKICYHVVCQ